MIWPAKEELPDSKYRRLDPQRIIETVQTLQGRIEGRFPGSGLGNVVAELRRVAEETVARTQWIQKPHLPLRFAAVLLSAAIVALLVGLLVQIRHFQLDEYSNSVQALEASISSVVFIGAAVVFLVSWEHRIKRNRALKAIHELRALAHIVDMHQLTKDPESYFRPNQHSTSPPRRAMTPFELNRYLDYCSESLALISKIAALYVQEFQDQVLLDAVDDVEDLTSGFSGKIGQKLSLLETLGRTLLVPRADTATDEKSGTLTSKS
jgi:fumarate reductase subunit D